MANICEHEFEEEDLNNPGYSQLEYDLYAKLNMTIRKNHKLNQYEIIDRNTKTVAYTHQTIEGIARQANQLENAPNTHIKRSSGCPHNLNPADTYQKNWEITEAMTRFGGSFVKALGRLWRIGDLNNQRKLRNTFPEYWREYDQRATQRKKKNPEWYKSP